MPRPGKTGIIELSELFRPCRSCLQSSALASIVVAYGLLERFAFLKTDDSSTAYNKTTSIQGNNIAERSRAVYERTLLLRKSISRKKTNANRNNLAIRPLDQRSIGLVGEIIMDLFDL